MKNRLAGHRREDRWLGCWSGNLPQLPGVQLFADKTHAGTSTLTVGVLPIEPEHRRLIESGPDPGPIEVAGSHHLVRLRDPDGNLVVFASGCKS